MVNLTKSKKSKKSHKSTKRSKKNSLNHRKRTKYHSHLKKYSSRPSPKTSATIYKVGTIKRGNDGNKYVVVSTKGKSKRIKRWLKYNKKSVNSKKRRNISRNMKGGSCKISMGEESGFNVSDTGVGGGSPLKGFRLGSSRFEIGRSCNNSKTGHAMV
jgi:hypothetical protein